MKILQAIRERNIGGVEEWCGFPIWLNISNAIWRAINDAARDNPTDIEMLNCCFKVATILLEQSRPFGSQVIIGDLFERCLQNFSSSNVSVDLVCLIQKLMQCDTKEKNAAIILKKVADVMRMHTDEQAQLSCRMIETVYPTSETKKSNIGMALFEVACRNKHYLVVKYLFSRKKELMVSFPAWLRKACAVGVIDIIKWFLLEIPTEIRSRAINHFGVNKRTALTIACGERGDIDIVHLLVESGGDIHQQNCATVDNIQTYFSPLKSAIEHQRGDIYIFLTARGVTLPDQLKEKLLFQAIKKCKDAQLEFLIFTVGLCVTNPLGNTALQKAIEVKNIPAIKILLKAGVPLDEEQIKRLHKLAYQYDDAELFQALRRDESDLEDVYDYAMMHKATKILAYLISKDIFCDQKKIKRVFLIAAEKKDIALLRMLRQKKMRLEDFNGLPPLYRDAIHQRKSVKYILKLLQAGYPIASIDDWLMLYRYSGHPDFKDGEKFLLNCLDESPANTWNFGESEFYWDQLEEAVAKSRWSYVVRLLKLHDTLPDFSEAELKKIFLAAFNQNENKVIDLLLEDRDRWPLYLGLVLSFLEKVERVHPYYLAIASLAKQTEDLIEVIYYLQEEEISHQLAFAFHSDKEEEEKTTAVSTLVDLSEIAMQAVAVLPLESFDALISVAEATQLLEETQIKLKEKLAPAYASDNVELFKAVYDSLDKNISETIKPTMLAWAGDVYATRITTYLLSENVICNQQTARNLFLGAVVKEDIPLLEMLCLKQITVKYVAGMRPLYSDLISTNNNTVIVEKLFQAGYPTTSAEEWLALLRYTAKNDALQEMQTNILCAFSKTSSDYQRLVLEAKAYSLHLNQAIATSDWSYLLIFIKLKREIPPLNDAQLASFFIAAVHKNDPDAVQLFLSKREAWPLYKKTISFINQTILASQQKEEVKVQLAEKILKFIQQNSLFLASGKRTPNLGFFDESRMPPEKTAEEATFHSLPMDVG